MAQAQDMRSLGMNQSQTLYEGLREPYRPFADWMRSENPGRLRRKQHEADEVFRLTGITFNVYGRAEAAEHSAAEVQFLLDASPVPDSPFRGTHD